MRILTFVLLLLLGPPALAFELCPGLHFKTDDRLTFNSNERRLLCGDPESHAWQKIPATQARYFARIFLQDRGYLNPQFEIRDGQLFTDVGPLQRVKNLVVVGAPANFRPDRRRNLRGHAMTPEILDETEGWAKARLQELGYACVDLKLQAYPVNGEIRLLVEPGPLFRFGEIRRFGMTTKPGLVERPQAFLRGQIFDPEDRTN